MMKYKTTTKHKGVRKVKPRLKRIRTKDIDTAIKSIIGATISIILLNHLIDLLAIRHKKDYTIFNVRM